MAQAAKEIGYLWTFCAFCILINAADERGKRIIFGHNQDCSYSEYKDLVALENDGQCHSIDTVFPKLRDLNNRVPFLGQFCVHDIIRKLNSYFTSHQNTSGGCTCSGHVVYHPEMYHNVEWTCKNRDHNFDVLYAELFSDNKTGPCLPLDKVLVHLGSFHLDHTYCQLEIINHYSKIVDTNGQRCNCGHEPMQLNTVPTHTVSMSTTTFTHTPAPTSTEDSASTAFKTTTNPTTLVNVPTLTVLHTCNKVNTLSTLAHGITQTNHEAGNCHLGANDHQAPEALVLNKCNVTSPPETWKKGQSVVSQCARIPLYTPVATFTDDKYSNQRGLSGIFVGCLLDGFKIIVQACDQNITVMHVTTGHQPDPMNYFIIM